MTEIITAKELNRLDSELSCNRELHSLTESKLTKTKRAKLAQKIETKFF